MVTRRAVVIGNTLSANGGDGLEQYPTSDAVLVLDSIAHDNGSAGLNLPGFAAYGQNTLLANPSGPVTSSTLQVAPNLCDTVVCP